MSEPSAHRLWAGLGHHLAVEAILAGELPGTVIVDDASRPTAGLLTGANAYRIHVAGTARNVAFNQRAASFLEERRAAGERELVIYHDGGEWGESVSALLPGAKTTSPERRCLRLDRAAPGASGTPSALGNPADPAAWRGHISSGDETFQVRPITAELLREGLRHTDDQTEELCSESPSVEWFLAHEFGFCVQEDDAIAGFCTTEYTRPARSGGPARCELGVNTVRAFRRRGVATLAAAATIQEAHRRGIVEIGWHCWATNAASIALAHKLGFQPAADYSVWLCTWDEP